MAAPDLSREGKTWWGRHTGAVAVCLSLALHALAGLGLAWYLDGAPSEAPRRHQTPSGTGPADEDPFECESFLILNPGTNTPRLDTGSPPVAPPQPPPQPRLVALPQDIPSCDVKATAPPPRLFPVSASAGQGGNSSGLAAAFFGLPAQGGKSAPAQKIVYVLDRSGSMGQNSLLSRASRELLTSLAKLPPTTQFQVLVYNRRAEPLLWQQPHYMNASAENRLLVAQALEALRPDGGTDHGPALSGALSLRPDVIFYVTDADDLNLEHVAQVTRLNAGRAVIHTIELSLTNRQRPNMPLQELARCNGGRYQAVDPDAQPLLNNTP
jgi:hypothetical protein